MLELRLRLNLVETNSCIGSEITRPIKFARVAKAIPMESDRLLHCESGSPAQVSFCSERGVKLADNICAEQAIRLLEVALLLDQTVTVIVDCCF